MNDKIYYFAYGSNLDVTQINTRLNNATFIRKVKLLGYKIIFDNYASIMKTGNQNDFVEGIIYSISLADEITLDKYEGVKFKAYSKEYLTLSINNAKTKVLTYIKAPSGVTDCVDKYYFNKVSKAYAFWGFDLNNLPKVKFNPTYIAPKYVAPPAYSTKEKYRPANPSKLYENAYIKENSWPKSHDSLLADYDPEYDSDYDTMYSRSTSSYKKYTKEEEAYVNKYLSNKVK